MTQQCLDQVGNLWKWLGVDCLLTCLPPGICWAWQMCRAAQWEEPTPSWAGRPQLCISTTFVSAAEWGMVALAPLEWQVMSCKEADCAGKYILGPSLCLCCRDFGGFGLNTPTSSHSPSGALLKCFWAEQSSLHCWDHAAMEADLGEWGQQQDFLQKLLPSRTSPLPPAAQHGWWKERNLWEKNWVFCKKIFPAKCFSSLSTCGFMKILPTPPLVFAWWQQMQACWQKVCFSFAPFADSSEDLPGSDTPS